jgi:hypothetical protein
MVAQKMRMKRRRRRRRGGNGCSKDEINVKTLLGCPLRFRYPRYPVSSFSYDIHVCILLLR